MSVMVMPVMACRCSWRRAQQVIQNVNDGADVTFGPTVSVLKGRVQGTAERAGVHTFAVVMHTFYYGPLSASRILLNLRKKGFVYLSSCRETHIFVLHAYIRYDTLIY